MTGCNVYVGILNLSWKELDFFLYLKSNDSTAGG